MIRRAARLTVISLLVPAILLAGCGPSLKRVLKPPASVGSISGKAPFLNAHMRDGRFYALSQWRVDSTGTVSGLGELRDVNRELISRGEQSFAVDSVALFEANSLEGMPPAMKALTIVLVSAAIVAGVALIAFAIACANDPKCFGSCPTFYVTDGERPILQAEGFSASVSPALEHSDIDALERARPAGRSLEVVMKNEALETHVVRHVRLLAAERAEGGRVFATPGGEFWQAHEVLEPTRAVGPEGDCRAALAAFDGEERVRSPDSTDLAAREILDLEFANDGDGAAGLVIASRQTLLTTYLFYQALAYMGGSTGHWLAALERADPRARRRSGALWRELGGIEVMVRGRSGGFTVAGAVHETGPLATDVRVVPLPRLPKGPLNVRLRLTRGLWRLDWVALARLGDRVEPLRLEPEAVLRDEREDPEAREALLDSTRTLVTQPGDQYTLVYRLPEDFQRRGLFLETRGYYLEWMRERWLAEEDPARAAMLLVNPRGALRELAPAYARELPALEDWFWRSRYVHP